MTRYLNKFFEKGRIKVTYRGHMQKVSQKIDLSKIKTKIY